MAVSASPNRKTTNEGVIGATLTTVTELETISLAFTRPIKVMNRPIPQAMA